MPGRLHRSVLFGVLGVASLAFAQTATVVPTAQTAAADAGPLLPSVWVNPSNVDDSRVLSTDGEGNLIEFALDGGTFASLSAGASDLDIAYDVPLGGTVRDIAVVGTGVKTLAFFAFDGVTGALTDVTAGVIGVLSASGAALDRVAVYHSPLSGNFYVFVADRTGNLEQWQFFDDGTGRLTAAQVTGRTLSIAERLGGMVADEVDQRVFLTGQSQGLWRFDAEPGGQGLTLIDGPAFSLDLVAPVGGVALYRAHGTGYLLVANTGSSDISVYRRMPNGPGDYLTRFQIGSGNQLDGVQNPVGIAVMSFGLGAAYPSGLFVAHDAVSAAGGPDLKFVSWGDIALAGNLAAPDVTDNPHQAPDAGIDGGIDGGTDGGTGPPPSHHTGCSATSSPLGGLALLALLGFLLTRRRLEAD